METLRADAPEFVPSPVVEQVTSSVGPAPTQVLSSPVPLESRQNGVFGGNDAFYLPAAGIFCPRCASRQICAFHGTAATARARQNWRSGVPAFATAPRCLPAKPSVPEPTASLVARPAAGEPSCPRCREEGYACAFHVLFPLLAGPAMAPALEKKALIEPDDESTDAAEGELRSSHAESDTSDVDCMSNLSLAPPSQPMPRPITLAALVTGACEQGPHGAVARRTCLDATN
mmetsp:Transcript_36539/g.80020  ORF Transcript_36539/g.80020 Transcript_36539/m.80020 type:complete len:231 (-) Transcript_36539:78-770(-)